MINFYLSLFTMRLRLISISTIVTIIKSPIPTYRKELVHLYITQLNKPEAKSNAPPEKPSGIWAALSPVSAKTDAAAFVNAGAISVTKYNPNIKLK